MESNLLLEQYSWYKKQQLAKAPFECLLNADIEPNPHQVKQNTFVLCESCIGNFRIPSL